MLFITTSLTTLLLIPINKLALFKVAGGQLEFFCRPICTVSQLVTLSLGWSFLHSYTPGCFQVRYL